MNRLWNFKIDHMPTGDGFQLPLLLTARPLFVQGVETWEYILHISVSLLLKKGDNESHHDRVYSCLFTFH
jgi:hypothetical protein